MKVCISAELKKLLEHGSKGTKGFNGEREHRSTKKSGSVRIFVFLFLFSLIRVK